MAQDHVRNRGGHPRPYCVGAFTATETVPAQVFPQPGQSLRLAVYSVTIISGSGGRSNTCRRRTTPTEGSARPVPRPHTAGAGVATRSSGISTCRSVVPSEPACFPGLRPVGGRRFRGGRGILVHPQDERLELRGQLTDLDEPSIDPGVLDCQQREEPLSCDLARILHTPDQNTNPASPATPSASHHLNSYAGFGGMRDTTGTLAFAPRLPEGLDRLAFTITHKGLRLRVETDGKQATYLLTDHERNPADELEIIHHGELLTLKIGEPVTLQVPAYPTLPHPSQHLGREPFEYDKFR